MRIDWSQTIAGVPLIKVRDVLRAVGGYGSLGGFCIGPERFSEISNKKCGPEVDSTALLNELLSRGLMAPHRDGETFIRTFEGDQLAAARKLPLIKRATAEELLEKVLAAAVRVNEDPRYGRRISKLAVFGSYLRDESKLSDLDIGFELVRLSDDPDEEAAIVARSKKAFPPPSSANIVDRAMWPDILVLKTLHVSNHVSLHDYNEEVVRGKMTHRMLIGA